MEDFECKIWGEMSVTNTIFSRWELAVADNVYFKKRKRNQYWCADLQCLSVYHLARFCNSDKLWGILWYGYLENS